MEPGDSNQPITLPRVRIIVNEAKDRYCFYCDDGGSIIDCYTCDRAFCYRVMGEEVGEDEEDEIQTCITIPQGMIEDRRRRFRCPECLSVTPSSLPDKYIINRGSRSTRRITTRSSLGLVIFHLDSQQVAAQSLLEQVTSALCAFEVEIVTCFRRIGKHLDGEDASSIHSQLHFEGPYHLALIFLTESDPTGGWWISSERSRSGAGQTPEAKFIRYHTKELTTLATNAATARIFMLSCASNLFVPSTLGVIHDTMDRRPWHSIVLPTTPTLLVNEAVDILPDLFVHLYYFGAGFKSSLLRVWAKSTTTRVHTGFIIMDRKHFNDHLSVSKVEYAAQSIRPYGVHLPIPESLCGCWGEDAEWKLRHVSKGHGEQFYFLRSSCCAHELHAAIFVDRRTTRRAHGTIIMEEYWDESMKNFTFDSSRMPARRGRELEAQRPRHETPWTLAGRQA